MKKAIDYFAEFVQDNGRIPTLDEFKNMGYSKTTYYQSKRDYKPTEPEVNECAIRTNVEQHDNGISFINLKFFGGEA